MYTPFEDEEHIGQLSARMQQNRDRSKLLEEVYPEAIIKEIDVKDIRSILNLFTYESCKLVLIGNSMFCNDSRVPLTEPLS